MAARRLVIVMLVLLGISSLAALLAPTAEREETTTTDTTQGGPSGRHQPSGRLVRAAIDARRGPQVVSLRAGDQLALVVRWKRPDSVEIPSLGELEDVDPDSPARFDLLPPKGQYPIRLAEGRRRIGEIVVGASESRRRG